MSRTTRTQPANGRKLRFSLGISETLLIALAPVAGYATAYQSELVWITYYSLPASLIVLSSTSLFIGLSTVGFYALLVVVGYLHNQFSIVRRLAKQGIHLDVYFIFTVLTCVLIYLESEKPRMLYWLTAVFAAILLYDLVAFILRKDKKIQKKMTASSFGYGLYNLIHHPRNDELEVRFTFFLLLIILLPTMLIQSLTHYNLENKEDYFVLVSDPHQVLIKLYGDKFIIGTLNENRTKFTGEFTVHNNQDNQLVFQLQHTGRIEQYHP